MSKPCDGATADLESGDTQMTSPVQIYQAEMHRNLGFFATWLPGDPIEIGDAGVLVDGRFRRLSSLKDIGIASTASDVGAPHNVQYTSTKGTKIDAATGAGIAGVAKGEITIAFSADGAFVFQATGLRARRLQELPAIARGVLAAYEKGRWRKEWLLIEALHTADCATIIVSQDNSASLVLAANADGPISMLGLADPKVGLKVSSSRGKLIHVVGGRALRPLYSCLRIQAPLLSGPSLTPARGTATQPPRFERAQIGDLLNN
jgi:hypothetical protein